MSETSKPSRLPEADAPGRTGLPGRQAMPVWCGLADTKAAYLRPAPEGSAPMEGSATFETHPVRGRFNAWFFTALDSYINWLGAARRAEIAAWCATVRHAGPGDR